MISDFRQAVITVVEGFKTRDDATERLVRVTDDGGQSVNTPNKVPTLNLNQCPYLEVGEVLLNSEDGVGQYEVQLTVELTLWTKGWELTLGDRFLSLIATSGLRAWRRPPYNYKVSVSGQAPERKFQTDSEGGNGQPVMETKATLTTKLCFTT